MFETAFGPSAIPQAVPANLLSARHAERDRQLIIAGTDDDVTAADLFEWIHPILAAIPGGRWSRCELECRGGGQIVARFRCGTCDTEITHSEVWCEADVAALSALIPRCQALVMIMLGDYASQAMSLLDGIVRWLSIHEPTQAELAPVIRLLEKLEAEAKLPG